MGIHVISILNDRRYGWKEFLTEYQLLHLSDAENMLRLTEGNGLVIRLADNITVHIDLKHERRGLLLDSDKALFRVSGNNSTLYFDRGLAVLNKDLDPSGKSSGGGLKTVAGDLQLQGVTLIANECSADFGNGMYLLGGRVTIENGTSSEVAVLGATNAKNATMAGPGINIWDADIDITATQGQLYAENCNTPHHNSGIVMFAGTLHLQGMHAAVVVRDCHAGLQGGGFGLGNDYFALPRQPVLSLTGKYSKLVIEACSAVTAAAWNWTTGTIEGLTAFNTLELTGNVAHHWRGCLVTYTKHTANPTTLPWTVVEHENDVQFEVCKTQKAKTWWNLLSPAFKTAVIIAIVIVLVLLVLIILACTRRARAPKI